MNRSPIYTLLNHILPPTHSYKLAQIISIKEIIKKISSCNKYTYCHTKKKKKAIWAMETMLHSFKAPVWIFLALPDDFFQDLGTGPELIHPSE